MLFRAGKAQATTPRSIPSFSYSGSIAGIATSSPVTVARVSERLEMSDEALVLIADAHLLPGCDATIVHASADGVTVKTDNGEHRVPARVAESLYVLVR